jgi:acyl-CoA thioesterase FadM
MGLISDLDAVVNDDYAMVVVSQEIRHVKPLGYSRKPVVIEARVTDMARTSYSIVYRILDDDGETAAEATTRLAVVDAETGRPTRMSEALRERLTAAS